MPACQPWSTEADHCCSLLVSAPSPPAPVIDQIASPLEAQTEAQKEQKLFRRRARGCHCIGAVLNQLSWNWRECWQPAGSHASHWVARVGQARRCEASAWMSRRPSSWSKLSTIVERPGQPVALIPRKRGISCVRASVLPSLKNRDTFAEYLARYLIMHGGSRAPAQPKRLTKCLRINITLHQKG